MSQSSIKSLLQNYEVSETGKYVSQEFQDYAYRLAMDLSTEEDRQTIGMCMRLVKTKPRALLERAQNFVKDANAKKKVALFLWKLKELEKERKEKNPPEEKTAAQPNLFETT
jgi:hypothetical protein